MRTRPHYDSPQSPAQPSVTSPPNVMGSSNGKPVLREEDLDTISNTSGLSEQQIRDDFDIFVKARLLYFL